MSGHAMEVGQDFIDQRLPSLLDELNAGRTEPMPVGRTGMLLGL